MCVCYAIVVVVYRVSVVIPERLVKLDLGDRLESVDREDRGERWACRYVIILTDLHILFDIRDRNKQG